MEMKINVNIEKIEETINEKIEEILFNIFKRNSDSYLSEGEWCRKRIIEKISEMYVERFGEEIIQSISKEDMQQYIINRATLLGAKKLNEG